MKPIIPLFLVAAAMLASCNANTPASETSASSQEPTSSVAPSATYLDWVNDNKIVIDLFNAGEARFTYGNAALDQASNTLDLNASASLACSTTLSADQLVNFVIVTETISETGFNAGAALYSAIEGDQLSNFLGDNEDLKGTVRAYVAISFGNTVQWTKNKNAAMDAKIQQLINAAK